MDINYGKSILKNKMGISKNEVNMVNNGGSNCAKCNSEMTLPGGHCESGVFVCLSSRTTKYREMRTTYSQVKRKGKLSKL